MYLANLRQQKVFRIKSNTSLYSGLSVSCALVLFVLVPKVMLSVFDE